MEGKIGSVTQFRVKRMKIKIGGLIACGFFISSSCFSQTPKLDSPLTWTECVSIALSNNPDLASSRWAKDASLSSYYGSFNGLMPQVSLSNSYNDSNGSSKSPYWQAQGSVSLNVFNASQIGNIRTSEASLTLSKANFRQVSSLLRFNLRKVFAQLLFSLKNVEVSQNIKHLRQEESQLVTLRYDSGRESKGNMLRANAQLLQAEADLGQAMRDLRTSQRSLNKQLGLGSFTPITVASAVNILAPTELPKDEQSLLSSRPDIIVQEAVVKSVEANLKQSKSSLWPSLAVSYAREVTGSSDFPSSQYGWSFSGILNYPLFGSGPTATYFAISTAKMNLEKAKLDLRSIQDQAMVDLEMVWSNFAGAADQSKVQAALLEAARQRNNEADIRYASGLMTYDNWEIIASDRVSQERQAIQAELNLLISEANWGKALGKQLEE